MFLQEPSCDTLENTLYPLVTSEHLGLGSTLVFPELSELQVNRYINQQENIATSYSIKNAEPCVVPGSATPSRPQHYIPSRKLEVLRDCVAYIFDNKISEARKVLGCSRYLCSCDGYHDCQTVE